MNVGTKKTQKKIYTIELSEEELILLKKELGAVAISPFLYELYKLLPNDKSKEKYKCPGDGTFGIDNNMLNQCVTCGVWEECYHFGAENKIPLKYKGE